MLPFLREHFGNPSSTHPYGHRARKAVARAREQVAAALGCDAGGNPLHLRRHRGEQPRHSRRGRGARADGRSSRRSSSTRRRRPCASSRGTGCGSTRLGVDARRARPARRGPTSASARTRRSSPSCTRTTRRACSSRCAELAELAHAAGALVHTDAAQSSARSPSGSASSGSTCSASRATSSTRRRASARCTSGAARRCTPSSSARHERGLRPGTENVACIVGLGVAVRAGDARPRGRPRPDAHAARSALDPSRERRSRARAQRPSRPAAPEHAERPVPGACRHRRPRGRPEVAASTGSACHEGHESASAVILAMGVPPEEALGSVRLTLGRGTTEDDVVRAGEALVRSWKRLTRAGG